MEQSSNVPDKSGSMGASQSTSHPIVVFTFVDADIVAFVYIVAWIVLKCLRYSHYQSVVGLFKRNSSLPTIQPTISPVQQTVSPIQQTISPTQKVIQPIQQNPSPIIQKSISPIQRVPPEILREIFRQVLVLHLNPDSNSLARCKALVSLGQVCGDWRQICIEFPELWRHISICFYKRDRDRVLNLAKICLERARAIPLILDMNTRDESNANHLSIIMNALLPYFPRCKRLHLVLVAGFIPSLSTVHHSMRFLEHLQLTLTSDLIQNPDLDLEPSQGYVWTSVLTVFEDAPHLKSVVLDSMSVLWHDNLRKLNLPWSQLTHLEIRSYILESPHLALFSRCINLEQLTLGLLWPNGFSEVDFPRVVLPRLQDLHLVHQGITFFAIDNFLDSFSLPALRTMSIKGAKSRKFPINAFVAMQACSLFALTSLTITSFSFPLQSSDLKVLFRAIPSLVYFSLIDCVCSAGIFEALVYAESDPLLPRLQEIIIKENRGSEDPILSPLTRTKDIMDIVASRWWSDALLPIRSIARLRKVDAKVIGRPLDLSELDKIAKYREEDAYS